MPRWRCATAIARQLVEALIASFWPDDRPPFDESWREIIRRRSDELRSGKVTPVARNEIGHPAMPLNSVRWTHIT
jgi:hypothetical protein